MGSSPKQPAVEMPAAEVAQQIQAALRLLLKAYDYARRLRRTCWDFAVEIQGLLAVGLTSSDLRWLVCQGHAEHAAEVARPGKNRQSFRHTGRLTFIEKTCVVLTEAGAEFAHQVLAGPKQGSPRNDEGPSPVSFVCDPTRVPRWDSAHREFRIGRQLVKRFKQPAPEPGDSPGRL